MYKLRLIFVITSLCLRCIFTELALMPLIFNKNGRLFAEVKIGSPPQTQLLKISTTLTQILVSRFISNGGYNSAKSTTYLNPGMKSEHVVIKEMKMCVEKVIDDITIGPYILHQRPLDNIRSGVFYSYCSGILGLGYNPKNESFLLDSIRDIKPKAFAIYVQKLNNTNITSLLFGDFNHLINEMNKKFYHTCAMNTGNELAFNCYVDSVYINMSNAITHHKIRQEVVFDMGTSAIFVSKEFFDHLLSNVYNKQLEQDVCSIKEVGNTRLILCKDTFTPTSKQKISFVIGKRSLSIDLFDLFAWETFPYRHSIFIYDVSFPNKWLFGTPFLTKYSMIFNKEASQLGFIKHLV